MKLFKTKKNAQIDKLLSEAESNIKRDRIILFGVIIFIEIALIIVSIVLRWFSISEFIVNIVNNIIGILPPILLFDFFYEKISSESSSIEMSKKITSTMMGQPETLKLFNIEDRKAFLKSTVNSVIVDSDLTDMILDNVNRYVIDPHKLDVKIRKEFNYNFELDEDLPEDYSVLMDDLKSAKNQYYLVQEILNYKAKQFMPEQRQQDFSTSVCEVKVGFLFNNDSLDDALRDKDVKGNENSELNQGFFVFRESLDLMPRERQRLLKYLNETDDEKTKEQRFVELARLCLKINGKPIELKKVCATEEGIICKFELEERLFLEEYSVRVIFSMPKKWGTLIEVALVDPTYAPKITLSYPRDKMKVDMYSFLNKCDNTSMREAHEQLNGVYDISLNEWVYPISGMVFTIEKKEKML